MAYEHVATNLERLTGRVLVVGDVMIDKYTPVSVRGVSPEGSHLDVRPVYDQKPRLYPGGAANSAVNIAQLGGHVTLVGLYAASTDGDVMTTLKPYQRTRAGGTLVMEGTGLRYKTIVKERLCDVAHNWAPLLRISHESELHTVERSLVQLLQENVAKAKVDAVLVSDYAKGVVSRDVMNQVYGLGVPVIIDTRPQNADVYEGAFVITPNASEARSMVSVSGGIDRVGAALRRKFPKTNVLITAGAQGMMLYDTDGGKYSLPAVAHGDDVIDITGAGDTVAAVIALGTASRLDLVESMEIASLAAGVVVRKRGTATADRREIKGLNRASKRR